MAYPYDDYEGYRSEHRGDDRERWRREGSWSREGWSGDRHRDEPEWRRGETWRGSGRQSWRGDEAGWRGDERAWRGDDWRRDDRWGRDWSSDRDRYREDRWGRDEYSRAPGGRDPRAARDALEGGDLGWHGGVRGAEGGGGYGEGFFGTAYSLYAGRPERIPSDRADQQGERMGRGPKGYRRSDDRIHDEIAERIARSGVNADEVEVKVENGEVTLTGTVERREDKWRLESLCDSVYGVDDVHNQLRSNDRQRRGSTTIPTH
jgi:hypothetical protein